MQGSLAERLRPKFFADLVGQDHLHKQGLVKLIEQDQFHNLLLWGPPGTGKTTIAGIIGATTERHVSMLSAVEHGVKDIRGAILASSKSLEEGGKSHLLFMDEIHRLSKNQQDALLKAIEVGTVKFLGATTENPSFEVNNAILSRCMVFDLKPLDYASCKELCDRGIIYLSENGYKITLQEEAYEWIFKYASGDGRKVLNVVETLAHLFAGKSVGQEELKSFQPGRMVQYDKDREHHYDTVSAFIKSIRATDPDAALIYLAMMLEGGEEPKFIARRLFIAASEDIGNANPTALLMANACMSACEKIGMPEVRIILGQTTTYLASSPKSNESYKAIDKALTMVRNMPHLSIPMHLRNAPTKWMKDRGYGDGYVYAHDQPVQARLQNNFPDECSKNTKIYTPSERGVERSLKKHLESKP